jgi:Leucine Rich Repeat (LRR) protein
MTPEEEAYEKALRRIREAERTGALELDLSGWDQTTREYGELARLNRLPRELERLTSLRSLNLYGCKNLSDDFSPLAGLTSLQTLDLSRCGQLSGDLSPLAVADFAPDAQTLQVHTAQRLVPTDQPHIASITQSLIYLTRTAH